MPGWYSSSPHPGDIHEDDEDAIALYMATQERIMLGVVPFGPLTREEQDRVDSYEAHMVDAEAEYQAQQAAGGRTICPQCGQRSITHRAVVTLGYAGHPGAEYSDLATCEREDCNYTEV